MSKASGIMMTQRHRTGTFSAGRSERTDLTDDFSTKSDAAATVGVEPQPVEFPAAMFGVLGHDLPGGIPAGAARQVQNEVGVLHHCMHYGLC